jgi:Flp pilus assembly protein TadD
MKLLALLLVPGFALAAPLDAQWHGFVGAGDFAKARALCEGWLTSQDLATKIEAGKCLASVALSTGEGPDKALARLDAAALLSPGDLGVAEARLRVLVSSRRASELPAALEKILKAHPGVDGMDAWMGVSSELQEGEFYAEGLAFTKVLQKQFPDDHRVLSNMAGFLALLGKRAEALPFAKRAVKLAPEDPIDNWNLAKLYDLDGKIDLADASFKKAIKFQDDPDERQDYECFYSQFLKKRHRPGAAKYEAAHCPGGEPGDD